MNRYLHPGYKFSLDAIEGVFKIKSVIGYGSSCAVYFVEFTDKNGICTEHLLKEYNPNKLELYRSESGVLFSDNDEEAESFNSGLLRFEEGYKKQLKIRKLNETKNTTSNIQGIYEGNGTKYIDMTCFNGLTYDKIQESNLYDLLRRTKTIAQIIKHYHNNGFLHLDLKPNNIFTIPESVELVVLFDFDSLMTRNEIMSGSSVSYTEAWAAPELLLPGRKSKICEATDLFSIGEMVFYQLFGRHSSADERRSFAKYEFDYDSAICKGSDPKVFPMLTDFFNKTICGVVSKRYISANEMLEALDQMIPLANPHEPRIVSSLPALQSFFVGRTCEIEKMHNRLEENDLLFVSGMGGIGKSELVKNFAVQYKDSYDAVIFAPYITDLMMLITDDKSVSIANIERFQGEQPVEYYNRKLRKLNELCNERTLFIIDNFDTAEDPHLNDILSLGCKKIITTRNNFADYNYTQIEIGSLAIRSDINSIFNQYYSKPLDEESQKTVDLIIDLVDGHTMTVELLAKQMKSGRATPQKMLDTLRKGGIGESGKEKVESGKDSNLSRQSAYDHIRALFDVSDLDENEIYILGNLSLIPHSGISTEQFKDWCELEDYETINSLVSEGWIRWDEEKDFISLHPVVSDIMFELIKEEKIDFEKLINSLTNCLDSDEYDTLSYETRKDINDISLFCTERIYRSNIESETVAYLLDSTAIETKSFGYLDLCIAYAEKAKEIREKLFGEESAEAAKSYNNLGELHKEKCNIKESEYYHTKALKIRKHIYGNLHQDTAESYGNLAIVYSQKGSFDKAEELSLNSLNIFLSLYGDKHDLISTSYNNLSEIYWYMNKFDIAIECGFKALEISNFLHGEMNFDSAISYCNLSVLYSNHFKDYDKAEKFALKALKISQSLFGEFYNFTAAMYGNLGCVYSEQGRLDETLTCYLNSLKISQKLVGDFHNDTAIAYQNIAWVYQEKREYDEAEKYFLKVLNIRKSLYGITNLQTADAYRILGTNYIHQERYSEAESNLKTALEITEEICGKQHIKTADIHNQLGKLYMYQHKYNLSEKHLHKALIIRTDFSGQANGEVAKTYNYLGLLFENQKNHIRAEDFYMTAYKIQQKVFGDNHYETIETLFHIGKLYAKQNSFVKAKEFIQKSYDISKVMYGENHYKTKEITDLLSKINKKL